MPGAPELILILAVVFLLFGGKKLPELARSLGKSSKEFKKGLQEGTDESDEAAKAEAAKPAPPAQPKVEASDQGSEASG